MRMHPELEEDSETLLRLPDIGVSAINTISLYMIPAIKLTY